MRKYFLSLLIATLVPALCINALAEEERGWRAAWQMRLTAEPSSSFPSTLILEIRNNGDRTLLGQNAIFNLYRNNTMYGWAIDEVLQREKLSIPPKTTIKRIIQFKNLIFSDVDGKNLPQNEVYNDLASGKWLIIASLSDFNSPKPLSESSFLVWSTEWEFKP